MGENPSLIQIKGLRDGLLITLGDAPWAELQAALTANIDGQPAFFQGARAALDIGNQILHVAEMAALRDMLSERGVSLWAVLSNSPTTEQTAQIFGLATRISKPHPKQVHHAAEITDETALWVHQTLRSGMRVEFPGHIVVMGDVNPGAEVVAGGSVLIWGRLRGGIHAGSQGNAEAIIGALELSPTQLRIAGEISAAPGWKSKGCAEIVRIKDGQLVAEPWLSE